MRNRWFSFWFLYSLSISPSCSSCHYSEINPCWPRRVILADIFCWNRKFGHGSSLTQGITKSFLCPIEWFCHPCWKSSDHMCKSLFFGSLCYYIGLCVCLYASTTLFWLLELCRKFWNQQVWDLQLSAFSGLFLVIWSSLNFEFYGRFFLLL